MEFAKRKLRRLEIARRLALRTLIQRFQTFNFRKKFETVANPESSLPSRTRRTYLHIYAARKSTLFHIILHVFNEISRLAFTVYKIAFFFTGIYTRRVIQKDLCTLRHSKYNEPEFSVKLPAIVSLKSNFLKPVLRSQLAFIVTKLLHTFLSRQHQHSRGESEKFVFAIQITMSLNSFCRYVAHNSLFEEWFSKTSLIFSKFCVTVADDFAYLHYTIAVNRQNAPSSVNTHQTYVPSSSQRVVCQALA